MQNIDNEREKNLALVARLSEILRINDWKRIDLAKAIQMSPTYIYEIFSGVKPVPKTLSAKLEDHLGVNRKWFDNGEGEMYAENQLQVEHVLPKSAQYSEFMTVTLSFKVNKADIMDLSEFVYEVTELAHKYSIMIE